MALECGWFKVVVLTVLPGPPLFLGQVVPLPRFLLPTVLRISSVSLLTMVVLLSMVSQGRVRVVQRGLPVPAVRRGVLQDLRDLVGRLAQQELLDHLVLPERPA